MVKNLHLATIFYCLVAINGDLRIFLISSPAKSNYMYFDFGFMILAISELLCASVFQNESSCKIFVMKISLFCTKTFSGFSLRTEVAGAYNKIARESGHSAKNLTSTFYRLMKFSRKIPFRSWRILRSPMLNEHPAGVGPSCPKQKSLSSHWMAWFVSSTLIHLIAIYRGSYRGDLWHGLQNAKIEDHKLITDIKVSFPESPK